MSRLEADLLVVEQWHIEEVNHHMRPADRAELEAVRGWSAEEELLYGVANAEKCRACVVDGRVLAIFGDTRHDQYIGLPWMVSTHWIEKYPRQFLSECRGVIEDMRSRHRYLLNFADVRNELAVKWLKSLGFDFHAAIPYGINGEPFYPFEMEGLPCADQ